MSVPKLSKQSEQAIGEALSEVSDMVEQGSTPNEAIVKVATARSIPAGHVRIMARAYNNGKTVNHVQTGETLTDKAASFPLADPVAILDEMYPDNIKAASDAYVEERISADYSMSPSRWLQRRTQAATFEKVASAETKTEEAPTPDGQATGFAGERMWASQQKLARTVDQLKHEKVAAAYRIANVFDKLASYFHEPTCLPHCSVHENVKLMFGDRGDRLMAKIAKDNEFVTKKRAQQHMVNWEVAPYALVKDALDAIDEYTAADAALEAGVKTAAAQKQETLRPFVPVTTPSIITGSVWDGPSGGEKSAEIEAEIEDGKIEIESESSEGGEVSAEIEDGKVEIESETAEEEAAEEAEEEEEEEEEEETEKMAVSPLAIGAGAAIGGGARAIGEKLIPKSKPELVESRMDELGTTEHENKLREIQTQTMLHDLMLNDPVISGYDPEQVMSAFNHLSEVAPEATHKRLLAQALMRQYLSQGDVLDPYDVNQLLDVERKLKGQTPLAVEQPVTPGKPNA